MEEHWNPLYLFDWAAEHETRAKRSGALRPLDCPPHVRVYFGSRRGDFSLGFPQGIVVAPAKQCARELYILLSPSIGRIESEPERVALEAEIARVIEQWWRSGFILGEFSG